jgi:microcystin-dependent protein
MTLPVGSITFFSGNLSAQPDIDKLTSAGWLICNGEQYQKATYPELYQSIGTQNGGDSDHFNVPDLRDRFIRGVDSSGSSRDPDISTRIAAAEGGSVDDQPGSLQLTATGLPVNKWSLSAVGDHAHTVPTSLGTDYHHAWWGSTYYVAANNRSTVSVDNSGEHYHTLDGFDSKCIPVSISLYAIIKAKDIPSTIDLPIGVIVALGSSAPPTNWLDCDGKAYSAASYQDLQNILLYNFGGDGKSVFNTPDFRGYFLRGTNHLTGIDPNAKSRFELQPGGNIGDAVGSAQLFATKSPSSLQLLKSGSHSHNVAHIPTDYHNTSAGVAGAQTATAWNSGTTTTSSAGSHNHPSINGGDKESRPENIYQNFIVSCASISDQSPPVGSIMAFSGDTTDIGILFALHDKGWLPCNGSFQKIQDYSELYSVIGGIYGSAPLKFGLPDLRGRFIIGAGNQPIGKIFTQSTTGKPNSPFLTSSDGDHSHTLDNVPVDSVKIDVVMGWEEAEWDPNKSSTSNYDNHTHTITGGDLETRPRNVNVDFIIRYK